ncbi:MAG: ComF family protein [Bacteroides sp.]|nr:ComF family protein [Bacillota bacterium]MCM1393537.1 ComF family protein [[Eubacterium] siraeum]MCM1455341.1 ComF family protein [Bacteroides sp.]
MDVNDRSERELRRAARKEKLGLKVWEFFNALRLALFPEDITCDLCGEELTFDTRYNLCADCTAKLPRTGEHICLVCGAPLSDESDFCIRCENEEREFDYNRSPLVYEGNAQKLILALKFANKKYIAKTLGAMMADEYLRRKMSAEIAVYVPMTEWEEKRRGFNQSELLAREVADRLGLPLLPALVKTKDTSAQKQLTRKEREENLKGAFECVYGEVKHRSILLIDDVFTTGATANACTHALIRGGAREVFVLTAAVTKKKIAYESADKETLKANADGLKSSGDNAETEGESQ